MSILIISGVKGFSHCCDCILPCYIEPVYLTLRYARFGKLATSQKFALELFDRMRQIVIHHSFPASTNMSDSDDQAGVPLLDNASDSDSPRSASVSKRKRNEEDETATATSKRAAKRQKMKKKKPQGLEDEMMDLKNGLNPAIGYMDSRLLSDHIAQRTKRFRPDMSLVEAEDVHISGMNTVLCGLLAWQ